MNDTSITIRSGRYGSCSSVSARAFDALDHRHARVAAQAVVELPVGDVERDDVRAAPLQQAVGEAAGRGADVERLAPGDGKPEGVQSIGELDPAARHVRRRAFDLELDLRFDELPRFLGPPAPGAEVHLAGDDGRRGARAGIEQATLRQQGVQAHARHGVRVPAARRSSLRPRPPMVS